MIAVQVAVESLYLTDDTNHAVFPNNNGEFASYQLSDGGHFMRFMVTGPVPRMRPCQILQAEGILLLQVHFRHFRLLRDHRHIQHLPPLLRDHPSKPFRGKWHQLLRIEQV